MSYENWKDKIGTFEVMDVRGKKMDFFPALKAKAAALKNGEGLHIIQTFEPVPLYPVLALMGKVFANAVRIIALHNDPIGNMRDVELFHQLRSNNLRLYKDIL